ncbi:MAG: S26 family signal peptidase [Oscillospiraceae bacterium]|nr:S26 family signal peptidase [Oscillospiraceae bacterium]
MIYTKKHLDSLLSCSYIERELGKRQLMYISVFLGIVTIALHSLLETVSESVITEIFPQIMLPSYYTIAFKYNLIAYVFFFILFMYKYNSLTFAQINKNKWYLLKKMNHSIDSMIILKIINTTLTVATIYTLGFIVTMVMALLFKYTFILGYLLSLYIVGLIDILMLVWSAMFISLFIKKRRFAVLCMICFEAAMILLQNLTGYSQLIKDRYLMTFTGNLFDIKISSYTFIICTLLVGTTTASCIFAKNHSAFYFNSNSHEAENAAMRDYKTNKLTLNDKNKSSSFIGKSFSILLKTILMILIAVSIGGNVFILVLAMGSSTKEFSIGGYIPYIVQSTSMENSIYKNDLVLFKRVDTSSPIEIGSVVIFREEGTVYIEQVTGCDKNIYTVDITNYPEFVTDKLMEKEVYRDKIYGILYKTNRWIGAFVLFANTFFGRILLFVIPVLLIFFSKQLAEFIKRFFTQNNGKTEKQII